MRLFLTLCTAALLASCTVPTTVLLLNASMHDVSVSYVDEYRNPVAKVVRVGEIAESLTLLEARFSIRRALLVFEYSPDGIPDGFVENAGFGPFISRVVKTQLEKDGCIYMVPKAGPYPAADHGAQPAGFPLCPTNR